MRLWNWLFARPTHVASPVATTRRGAPTPLPATSPDERRRRCLNEGGHKLER
jgi:hypothetical protein